MRALARAALSAALIGCLAIGAFPLRADADDPIKTLLSPEVLQAIDADNALFDANELLNPPDPTARQTISVSFFAGHIGPVQSGQPSWTNTDSDDSDPYSMELRIPDGTFVGFNSSFAGINLHHVPAIPPVAPPSFDFKADKTAGSGGSPRLVVRFADGGNIQLRPLSWTQNVWTSEGPVTGSSVADPLSPTNWESNGGICGFTFEVTYATALACHPAAVVISAFIVSDSGWLSAPYVNRIDNIQYNGQVISQPPDNSR